MIKVGEFEVEISGECFEIKHRGLFVYTAIITKLPDDKQSMNRDEGTKLMMNEYLEDHKIKGIESFAKGNIHVGSPVGIALEGRLYD